MKLVAWFVLAYCAINIANVEAGGKSMVVYIKDESNSNELVSVEVDKEFYSTILQLINSNNKRTTPVNKMDSSKDFLEMVSGGNCKCQCMCCDETRVTPTPPTRTTPSTTTKRTTESTTTRRTTTPSTTTKRTTESSTTRRTTTPSTTTKRTTTPSTTTERTTESTTTRRTTTPSTTTRRTTTPSTTTERVTESTTTERTTTPSTTTRRTITPSTTTERVTESTPKISTTTFTGPTYLPPATVSTSKRPPRTTRTYGTFTQYNVIRYNYTLGTYVPRERGSTRPPPVITTTPKYAYYKPKDQFYYPGEGLQVVENGKIVYAVEPVNEDQSIASIKVPTNKWNFLPN